jgi:hypothetical protein
MHIRPLQVDDHPSAIKLLVQTFGPLFNDYVRPRLGEQMYRHQHGRPGLCEHAIGHMRAGDVEVVQIGTGGRPVLRPSARVV